MDIQHLFDAVLAALAAGVGFVARTLHMRLTVTEDKIANLHLTYVKRDDFKEHVDRVYDILQRIEDKLDGKADK